MLLFFGNQNEKRAEFYSPKYDKKINYSPINKNEIKNNNTNKPNKDIIAQVDKKLEDLMKRFGKANHRKQSKEKNKKETYDAIYMNSNANFDFNSGDNKLLAAADDDNRINNKENFDLISYNNLYLDEYLDGNNIRSDFGSTKDNYEKLK